MIFAKHLPPSAGRPRVLALDGAAAAELPPEVTLVPAAEAAGALDAIVGYTPPDALERWLAALRPGGRLILACPEPPDALLAALTAAGFVHCLVEPVGEISLYRGERPPLAASLDRIPAAARAPAERLPFVFLLVRQTPNKPAWRLAPGETVRWQAASALDPARGAPALLAFSSLVQAVAFMQPAVLAGFVNGVNKVAKFPAEAALDWPVPFLLNPVFDDWRDAARGPWLEVDPAAAITGDE
jgi:hypothetical protein